MLFSDELWFLGKNMYFCGIFAGTANMLSIEYENWGEVEYNIAWQRQEQLMQAIIADKQAGRPTRNRLVFCTHPHVYTIGKSGKASNMLIDDGSVPIVRSNRGGDITYHGPGQLVGYPIFDLEALHLGLKRYIACIEQCIIDLLENYGITGERLEGATGVWIDPHLPSARKICAIGVRCSRFVTMHGFALNVNTDLSYFSRINPCGFTDKGVTSLAAELGTAPDYAQVCDVLLQSFCRCFKSKIVVL